MRPVDSRFPINQPFGSMKTAGVVGNINASQDTVEYYVGRYGNYQPAGHAGCDIACPEGTPVYAMAAGTVLWADWGTNLPGDDSWSPSGYFRRWALYKGFPGIVTVIQHDGWIGVYAHLSAAWLNPGDVVSEGMQIGLSGGTGGVDPHLHVEALIDLGYTTGGGLIYGRTDPTKYFGTAAIAPQGTTNPSKELFTVTQFDDLMKQASVTHQKLNGLTLARTYDQRANQRWHGQTHAKVNALAEVVQQLAKGQGVTLDMGAIEAASKAGAAEALEEVSGINAADLAAAIPAEMATQVADELGKRLNGGK